VYPNDRVAGFIGENFIPVKIHIKEQPDTFKRFRAQWPPTLVILDRDGVERHRFEGFLPASDFLAQLALGLAHAAFGREQWREAEERYRAVVRDFPATDAAPEALYWAGVSRYKAGDQTALADTAKRFQAAYPATSWAKKASVWAH
jgi:hypothetical protein